jgi:hypothetical protein
MTMTNSPAKDITLNRSLVSNNYYNVRFAETHASRTIIGQEQ